MPWLSVMLDVPHNTADAWGDALLDAGAISVNVDDATAGTDEEKPIFGEPGAEVVFWQHCKLTTLFPANHDVETTLRHASSALNVVCPAFTASHLEDEDWVSKNRDQFQPIHISDRLWIVPTWHRTPDDSAINIVLDPGAAFGTGNHPTTRLCLLWLEAHIDATQNQSILDYGCGSGILAIAAKKFGAQNVHGVDIDPQAVDVARYNAMQNNVNIAFSTASETLDFKADITVANILANPLKILAPLLAAHTRENGYLVLAGILDEQASEIIRIYQPWFDLAIWKSEEGWACIAGKRKA